MDNLPVDIATADRIMLGPDETVVLASCADTNGDLFAVEVRMQPGGGPPVMHRHEPSEIYFVKEGVFTFYVGTEGEVRRIQAGPGDVVPLKGGTPHTVRNESAELAVAVAVHTPGQPMETFCRTVAAMATDGPPEMAAVLDVAARSGIEMLGPIPPDRATSSTPASRRYSRVTSHQRRSRTMDTVARVHDTNHEQVAAWDGMEGSYWASHPDQFDRVMERYQPLFHEAAAIASHHRVLDVGCGTGLTTRQAARSASQGLAVGVDLSAEMLAVARSLTHREQIHNAHFLQADAQVHQFESEYFDTVISRTGSMFFGRPQVAFANLARALRPGGRLTLLTWQPPSSNEWISALTTALLGQVPPTPSPDVPGPFSLSKPGHVRELLRSAGFEDIHLDGRQEPMIFGRDADEAHEFTLGLLGWMLQGKSDRSRKQATESLHQLMVEHQGPSGVGLDSAAWIITARRASP